MLYLVVVSAVPRLVVTKWVSTVRCSCIRDLSLFGVFRAGFHITVKKFIVKSQCAVHMGVAGTGTRIVSFAATH